MIDLKPGDILIPCDKNPPKQPPDCFLVLGTRESEMQILLYDVLYGTEKTWISHSFLDYQIRMGFYKLHRSKEEEEEQQ